MMKRTLLVCFITSMTLTGNTLFASSPESRLAKKFEAYFKQQVEDEKLPGAAFVIADSDGSIRIGTVGHTDTSRKKRIDKETAFRVASVSKTFAAGLTGLLIEEGEFSWKDRVVNYVPDFQIKGDTRQLRVEHLLGQSTGLIPHAYDNLIEDGLSMDRIQPQFAKLDYICTPGECYSYQNSIFSLIEPIIETTTDQGYAELMERRIFQPLGMNSSSVGYESFVENANRAHPHVKSRGRWTTVKVKPNYYRVAPAAGVNASISDMGRWVTAHLGGNPSVIDPDMVGKLTAPRVKTRRDTRRKYWRDLISDAHYALGWRVYTLGEHAIAYHSGWVSGYRADVAFSDELDIGIAVLTNTEGSTISDLTTTFWQMAFESLDRSTNDRPSGLIAVSASGQ